MKTLKLINIGIRGMQVILIMTALILMFKVASTQERTGFYNLNTFFTAAPGHHEMLRPLTDLFINEYWQNIGDSAPMKLTISRVEILMKLTLAGKITFTIYIAMIVSIFLFILQWVNKIIRSIQSGESFSEQNIRNLRNMGIAFISLPVLERLFIYFQNLILSRQYHIEGMNLKSEGSFGFMVLISGLLIYVISYAFKQAKVYKEENELTI